MLAGRLLLKECIGGGGMGWVYAAHHLALDKPIAVKVLRRTSDPAHSARFVREARSTSKLDHPNIVSILDFGEDGDDQLLYLAMEEIIGETLADILARGALTQDEAIALMLQILAALAHAHKNGVVHRDLKPANVMVVKKENDEEEVVDVVKVVDFGLVKPVGTDGRDENLTRKGVTVGTPEYMSPEQCLSGNIDPRTDVYACGVMLYEMLAGRPPFVGDDPAAVIRAHVEATLPPLESFAPDVDPELMSVVEWALEKRPNRRCPSAIEMRRALSRIREADPFDVRTAVDASSFRRVVSESSSYEVPDARVVPVYDDAPSPTTLESVTEDISRVVNDSAAEGVVMTSPSQVDAIAPDEDDRPPFWLWSQVGQLVGPMSYFAMSRALANEAVGGHHDRAYVSADCRTWTNVKEFARLTEQEGVLSSARRERGAPATARPLELFAHVTKQRPTGTIVIEGSDEWAEIEVAAGAPTQLRSSDPMLQLPHLLVDRGFLQRDKLMTVMHEALRREASIVDVLAPLVDVTLLQRAVIREQISRLFTWFDARGCLDVEAPVRPRAPLVESMLEGVVSLVALGVPLRRLRDGVAQRWTTPLSRSADFQAVVGALHLLPGELSIVEKLDGRTSPAEVMRGTPGFGKAQIALIYTLIETGALEARDA
jgi:serine/threonine protein kinase